ncbi:MAG TPA: hypothetical protein PKZ52_08465, partial [Cellvibrionaceae bacterium]|nr:hypothetical protein [Cellvibrionaceae bacterium]
GLNLTEWLLDKLTHNLFCSCHEPEYACSCRVGISKIVGTLLDHYFSLAEPPFYPVRVWQWVNNLHFRTSKNKNQSAAVKTLQENQFLRQGIIAHALGEITDKQQINDTYRSKFSGSHTHSGLILNTDDFLFIVDLAFQTNNLVLWTDFIAYHYRYSAGGTNTQRRKMRQQALKNPIFMQAWLSLNRAHQEKLKEYRHQNTLRIRRTYRKEKNARLNKIKYIQEKIATIETGQNFDYLLQLARFTLFHPQDIEIEFGDEALVRRALRNCLNFLTPLAPDLPTLAELHCTSKTLDQELVIYAACLENFRANGNLNNVALPLLKSLRIIVNVGGLTGVSEEDRNGLREEIDHIIFPDTEAIEQFLREYIEPQLTHINCSHANLGLLLNDNTFSNLRATLSIDWLKRFPDLALEPLNKLFEAAAEYGNRNQLKTIIDQHCSEFMSKWPTATNNDSTEQKRQFWLLRAWCFLDETPDEYWNWIAADKNTLLTLDRFYGQLNRGYYNHWPNLTSTKIEAILNAFIDKWPKVDLPCHFGAGRPAEERAYRFLTNIIWLTNKDTSKKVVTVLERLIANPRLIDSRNDLKSILAEQIRKRALQNFRPPPPDAIVQLLDHNEAVTVEGLRQQVLQELQALQGAIDGGEYNTTELFYADNRRKSEEQCRDRIAEQLQLRLKNYNITITLEHQFKDAKRCDFAATKTIDSKKLLLATEVKGQWHKDLYTAPTAQLLECYASHTDAEQQGIFLVIWYGPHEKVANRKLHGIASAQELKQRIEEKLPNELRGRIDVFVLDVSRHV